MVTGGAEHASKPVIPCRVKEEFRAVALARVGCLLTGALMVRLIRASPATPSPARRQGPRRIRQA